MNHRYNEITKLSSLINEYDAFIFDVWGVLHSGGKIFDGVSEIYNLLDKEKIVRIITNSPRTKKTIQKSLLTSGINVELDKIFTSGETAKIIIKNSKEILNIDNPKIYHIGEARNNEILNNLDIDITDNIYESNLVLLSAYRDHDEDHSDVISELEIAANLSKKVICANPDTDVMHLGKARKCAGYFAKIFEEFGGKVFHSGKPEKIIFNECFKSFDGKDKKILMIGDTFHTDIKGAKLSNINAGLVLTGNMGIQIERTKIQNPLEAANKIIMDEKFQPDHIVTLE